MNRWQRYWFADGGRTSAAIVRVAIAVAVLLSLRHLASLSTVQIPGPASVYHPVGIWMLFGSWVPPASLVTLLWIVAWAGSIAMLLGLATRATTVASFVATLALVSASYASARGWSHTYNVVMLAHLAFLGARGGDTLSLDALIRRWRGQPELDVPRGYQWSLRLVQLAVALMFFGAALHKLGAGGFQLRWALSDNLRHQLLVHYDLAGHARPALVDWLLADSLRYQAAAIGNLLSQATPILACIFVRRPRVRLFAGAVFALEVLGLGLVVSLWNEHWFPLVAIFVDWDWLLRRPAPAPAPADWRAPRAPQIFAVIFVLYDLVTALVPGLDQRLNTYPFSAFPMFASVRVLPPFDEHRPYGAPGDHYEVTSTRPLSADEQIWFDYQNRRLWQVTSPAELERRLRATLATARQRYGEQTIVAFRDHFTIFEAAAYPAPARFTPTPVGILGEITADGTFRTVLGRFTKSGVELRPQYVDVTTARLVYYADDLSAPYELAATRDGNTFTFSPIRAANVTIVAIINETAWLVAHRK